MVCVVMQPLFLFFSFYIVLFSYAENVSEKAEIMFRSLPLFFRPVLYLQDLITQDLFIKKIWPIYFCKYFRYTVMPASFFSRQIALHVFVLIWRKGYLTLLYVCLFFFLFTNLFLKIYSIFSKPILFSLY